MERGDVFELGEGHVLKAVTRYGTDEVIGFVWEHPAAVATEGRAAGEPCGGIGIWISGEHPVTWRLESESPLTLSPSLGCRGCGAHIYVRDGRAQVLDPMTPDGWQG